MNIISIGFLFFEFCKILEQFFLVSRDSVAKSNPRGNFLFQNVVEATTKKGES